MNSEHRYTGLEVNKVCELYYRRDTGSGNNKFHDPEYPDWCHDRSDRADQVGA